MKARLKQLKLFAERIGLTPADVECLSGLLAGAVSDERGRCMKVARREARRICPDPDSIQYRVGYEIAKVIGLGR